MFFHCKVVINSLSFINFLSIFLHDFYNRLPFNVYEIPDFANNKIIYINTHQVIAKECFRFDVCKMRLSKRIQTWDFAKTNLLESENILRLSIENKPGEKIKRDKGYFYILI